ncbi:MAG: ABC transporter permease [Chloroflexota bacterium]
MKEFIARRLASLVLVLLGMSLLTFVISRVIPADPAAAAAGEGASIEAIENIRHQMGLDLPLHEQYLKYVSDIVLHGDFGDSILNRQPVLKDILTYAPASLELAMVSLFLCVPLGIVLGVVSASRAGGASDAGTRAFAILGVSMPVFWLGLLLQLVFYRVLHWLPPGGRLGNEFVTPATVTGLYLVDTLLAGDPAAFLSTLQHLVLPAVTLAVANLAIITRMTRSSLLDVLHQDYIRTARAKGLSYWRVLFHHALKPAAIPVVTVVGLQLASLIAWVFLVETIFSWPGIGSYAVRAILSLDFQAIMGVTLFTSFIYVAINLAVDILYRLLDPRIRF